MSRYARWYAAKKRMQEAGTWRGRGPSHPVPALEEGEPPTKKPKGLEPDSAGGDPEEGTSKQAQEDLGE